MFINYLLFFISSYHLAYTLPVMYGQVHVKVPSPEVLGFLRRFGYLEKNPNDSEALYHESALVEAIKNVQKYGALKPTGHLDNITLQLFHKPRCGVPDIRENADVEHFGRKKRFVFGAGTWNKRNIRYSIENWSQKISHDQTERDIKRALSVWGQYSGLKFERTNNKSADIIVAFGSRIHGDHFPFDGPGNILAHAFYPYEMDSWGGDVHFDEDENWQENAVDLSVGVDFYTVALHELGHSLGLAHTPTYRSIMFPYYKGPQHNILDYDDILAMYNAYLSRTLEGDQTEDQNDKKHAIIEEEEDTIHNEVYDAIKQGERAEEAATLPSPNHKSDENTAQVVNGTTMNPFDPAFICAGNFDAVCFFNESMHIFKASYVWKLTTAYRISSGYPKMWQNVFVGLPQSLKRIDACYERFDKVVVLFGDQQLWFWNSSKITENSPQPLNIMLGSTTSLVHAAMMWPKNNLTYIFANTTFWRYNDKLQQMDNGYPKSITRWPGIPQNLNAAATLPNGKTYFFKDNLYWLYNNAALRPERGYPRRASLAWLGCATKYTHNN